MTAIALGVDRRAGYPRALVEPLLWLATATGVLWLAVAIDAQGQVAAGEAPVSLPRLAVTLALVLMLNGIGALLLSAQGGSIARGLAAIAGIGMAVSGWGFTQIDELDPEVRHWLMIGSLAVGITLAVCAQLHWREIPGPPGSDERGVPELVVAIVLGVLTLPLARTAYDAYVSGLVGNGPRAAAAWSNFLPAMQAVTVMLATIGQVWNRRWVAAGLTLVIGGALTVALYWVTG